MIGDIVEAWRGFPVAVSRKFDAFIFNCNY
jgi:hypothetical protein